MIFIFLFCVGFVSGTVDAIAGGGGLISLPVLLSIGIPPHLALGTNKLQGTIGTFMAAGRYYRHGFISLSAVYEGVFAGLIGAALGSIATQSLSSHFLQLISPFLLLGILLYTLFSPHGKMEQQGLPRMQARWFYLIFGFGLGFYDGFFGPGTGSFWVFALTFFLGYNLIQATAYTKIFNLNSNLVATICFAIGGNIDYHYAITMALGSFLGGQVGANLAVKKGVTLIRPVFLGIVSLTIASLIYRQFS